MKADCAPCRRDGHLCPAALMSSKFDGEGLAGDGEEMEPMCLDCADGDPCAFRRCAGQGRAESSVTPRVDDFGALEFPTEQGAVVHRTPEELGVAAVVRDVPRVASWMKPPADTGPGSAGRSIVRKKVEVVIVSEQRPLPVMKLKEEKAMPVGKFGHKTPDEIRAKVLAEPLNLSATEVGKKYGLSCSSVWLMRKQAGLKGTARVGVHKSAAVKRAKAVEPRKTGQMIPVEIDPQRPGTASSLMGALAKIDQANEKITVSMEVTQAEIVRFVAGLTNDQRTAFMNAGVRAALFG